MVGEENQTTDNERQTTSNVGASETHTAPLKPIDTTDSVETPVRNPLSSSAAKISLKEKVAKNPAIRVPEEIELQELNITNDERENLLTER